MRVNLEVNKAHNLYGSLRIVKVFMLTSVDTKASISKPRKSVTMSSIISFLNVCSGSSELGNISERILSQSRGSFEFSNTSNCLAETRKIIGRLYESVNGSCWNRRKELKSLLWCWLAERRTHPHSFAEKDKSQKFRVVQLREFEVLFSFTGLAVTGGFAGRGCPHDCWGIIFRCTTPCIWCHPSAPIVLSTRTSYEEELC